MRLPQGGLPCSGAPALCMYRESFDRQIAFRARVLDRLLPTLRAIGTWTRDWTSPLLLLILLVRGCIEVSQSERLTKENEKNSVVQESSTRHCPSSRIKFCNCFEERKLTNGHLLKAAIRGSKKLIGLERSEGVSFLGLLGTVPTRLRRPNRPGAHGPEAAGWIGGWESRSIRRFTRFQIRPSQVKSPDRTVVKL